MRAETLERLLDAGFSKDEIMQLARDEPQEQPAQPEQQPQEEPEPQEMTDQTEQADTDPGPAQNPDTEVIDKINGLEKKFNDLIKTIQSQNLKNNYVDSLGDDLETQTDKIMQSIIRPEIAKRSD